MITPDLIRYIQTGLAAGKSKDRIKSDLMLAGGWSAADVDQAFAALQESPYTQTPSSKVGSFFLTVFIVLIILGGMAFAAEKYFGPVVSEIGQNIVAALPFGHTTQQPEDQTENTTSMVLPPSTIQSTTQTPVDTAPQVQTPVDVAVAPPVTVPSTPQPLVACKANDSGCLMQAAASCNPATETNTATSTQTKESSTRLYAVIGPSNNQCKFTFSVKSDTVKAHQGKGGLCTLSNNDLVTVLTAWNDGNYSDTTVDLASQCTGSYFGN